MTTRLQLKKPVTVSYQKVKGGDDKTKLEGKVSYKVLQYENAAEIIAATGGEEGLVKRVNKIMQEKSKTAVRNAATGAPYGKEIEDVVALCVNAGENFTFTNIGEKSRAPRLDEQQVDEIEKYVLESGEIDRASLLEMVRKLKAAGGD